MLSTITRVASNVWRQESCRAALVLAFLLHACFFQCLWGGRTLLESAQDAPSILFRGAWAGKPVKEPFLKVLDPGAPAWQTEPWFALIRKQYLEEKTLPLWNPYQGFGQPLAANMQSQPFYPLTFALAAHLTPKLYNWYILLRLFIAGFCAYLYLRLFLSFYPALAGGITSMLAGYYVLYITMPHLSVETLLPASLLAAEYLLRKQTYKTQVAFAVIILLVFLGGMPESAALLFLFVYLYLSVRIVCDAQLRPSWAPLVKRLLTATVAGVFLSAFFLLPFIGYLNRSANGHTPPSPSGPFFGQAYDHPGISIFTYLFPLLFGPTNSGIATHGDSALRDYIGIIPFFLITAAVISLARRPTARDRTQYAITCFFVLCILAIVLKRYGLLINFTGAWPILKLIDLRKYPGAILSVSASMLCALGLEELIRGRLSRRAQWLAFGMCWVVGAFAVFDSRTTLSTELRGGGYLARMVGFSLGFPVFLLAVLALWLVLSKHRNVPEPSTGIANSATGVFFAILLSVELSGAYIVPVYRIFNKLPRTTENPYVGAPFVDFLKSRATDHYRVFARDGVLMPNWAGAFGLYDIRDLDAMYSGKYFPFLQTFFPSWRKLIPDLESCFLGAGDYRFEDPLERRLLQLSSVKYLASTRTYTNPNKRIQEALLQNSEHPTPKQRIVITRKDFSINGDIRATLGEHPPYERLPYIIDVPEKEPIFHFSYGLDSAVFDKSGDGVGFTIELRDPRGRVTRVFSNYIDPKHNIAERTWMNGTVDLSAFRGKRVQLLFSTDPGPRGDSSYDWAGWSNFYFPSDPETHVPAFKEVYSGEPSVFEYDNVLPRAAVFYRAELVNDDHTLLRRLADPSLDIFRTVLLNASQLDQATKSALLGMNTGSNTGVDSAAITSYQSQSVTVHALLHGPGILMLNDTADPDWAVTIDNRLAQWFPADYMFRGVLLGTGNHTVQFVYRPRAFYAGLLISALAAIALIGVGVVEVRRRTI